VSCIGKEGARLWMLMNCWDIIGGCVSLNISLPSVFDGEKGEEDKGYRA